MDNKTYMDGVLETESNDFENIRLRYTNSTIRLDHAADGICTEAGEFKDVLKKHKYYGRELDKVNLVEELGDLLWYVNIAMDELGVTAEEVQQINQDKLRKKRYKSGQFTEDEAINRDVDAEREELERVDLSDTEEREKEIQEYNSASLIGC